MIVTFAVTQSIGGRVKWRAINNFGLLPLLAGLTLSDTIPTADLCDWWRHGDQPIHRSPRRA
jgi:hypothetical protein